jgi:hypothetical protein
VDVTLIAVNESLTSEFATVAQLQTQDVILGKLKEMLFSGVRKNGDLTPYLAFSDKAKAYLMQLPLRKCVDGVLYRRWVDFDRCSRWMQLLVPERLKD